MIVARDGQRTLILGDFERIEEMSDGHAVVIYPGQENYCHLTSTMAEIRAQVSPFLVLSDGSRIRKSRVLRYYAYHGHTRVILDGDEHMDVHDTVESLDERMST